MDGAGGLARLVAASGRVDLSNDEQILQNRQVVCLVSFLCSSSKVQVSFVPRMWALVEASLLGI